MLKNIWIVATLVFSLSAISCGTTKDYIPREPVSRIEIDNNFYMKIDFDEAWWVYLESSPKNVFSKQFADFRDSGLKPYFIAVTKDGMFGARCLAQTSLLSMEDFIPLLKESLSKEVLVLRNEKSYMFKNLPAVSWEYDFGEFTFYELVVKNLKQYFRVSVWMRAENFAKYKPELENLLATVDIIHK